MIANGLPLSPGISIKDLGPLVFAGVVVNVNSCANLLSAVMVIRMNTRRIFFDDFIVDSLFHTELSCLVNSKGLKLNTLIGHRFYADFCVRRYHRLGSAKNLSVLLNFF
jgi:hypothetical protein